MSLMNSGPAPRHFCAYQIKERSSVKNRDGEEPKDIKTGMEKHAAARRPRPRIDRNLPPLPMFEQKTAT
jgi:hypothetical protein